MTLFPISSFSKKRRGTTLAGIFSVALGSVLLLCGAGSAPVENFLPQGPMQADLNAGGFNVTNAATVSAANFQGRAAGLTNFPSSVLTLSSYNNFQPSLTLPELAAQSIVCDGDSITSGFGSTDGNHTYPGQLASMPFCNLGTVYNMGVSGSFITDLISRYSTSNNYASFNPMTKAPVFPVSCSAHSLSPAVTGLPAYYLLNIGTNDIYAGGSAATGVTSGSSPTITGLTFVAGSALNTIAVGYSVYAGNTFVGTVTAINSSAGTATVSANLGVTGSSTALAFCPALTTIQSSYVTLVNLALADTYTVFLETLIPNHGTVSPSFPWLYFEGNRLRFNAWIESNYTGVAHVTIIDTGSLPELQDGSPNALSYYYPSEINHPSNLGYLAMAKKVNTDLSIDVASTFYVAPFSYQGFPASWLGGSPSFNNIKINGSSGTALTVAPTDSAGGAVANFLKPSMPASSSTQITLGVGAANNNNNAYWNFDYVGNNSASNYTQFAMGGQGMIMFGSGNTLFQNSGAINDPGVLLDVNGTFKATGAVTLSNLSSNGFVKTSGGTGALSVDTSTYLTGNQTVTLSGDATGSGATAITVNVGKINGTSLGGLATGLLKNTTSTGVPSIAVAGTDYPGLASTNAFTGQDTFGNATGPVLQVSNTGSVNNEIAGEFMAPNLTAGQNVEVVFGDTTSGSLNAGGIGWQETVVGNSTTNFGWIGVPGVGIGNQLRFYASGNWCINETSDPGVALGVGGTIESLGNVISDSTGNGFQAKEGSNAKQGTATLSAGTATVSNTSVTATSRIFLAVQSLGTVTTPKQVAVTARTAGTSFTITSADNTDTSVVAYEIFEPAP